MKRWVLVYLIFGTIALFAQDSHAWLFDAEARSDVNSSNKYTSDNKYSSDNDNSINDSAVIFDDSNRYTNSNNRNDSHNDYRNYRYDNSVHDSSDRSDRSLNNSYNTTLTGNSFAQDYSTGKIIGSHNIQGSVSNSVLGNFDQRVGSDFSGGFNGTASTIEAAVSNTQVLGNFNVGGTSDK